LPVAGRGLFRSIEELNCGLCAERSPAMTWTGSSGNRIHKPCASQKLRIDIERRRGLFSGRSGDRTAKYLEAGLAPPETTFGLTPEDGAA